MRVIKQEIEFEECLKQRLEFICEFANVNPTFINGSIRKKEYETILDKDKPIENAEKSFKITENEKIK